MWFLNFFFAIFSCQYDALKTSSFTRNVALPIDLYIYQDDSGAEALHSQLHCFTLLRHYHSYVHRTRAYTYIDVRTL